MNSLEKRGFCRCGPNNLGVGEECKECGYVVPSKKYERAHFWTALLISAGLGAIAFFFVALPLITFFENNMFWKVLAAILCGIFSLKSVEIMGPYYDGEARWENPALEPDGFEGDEL